MNTTTWFRYKNNMNQQNRNWWVLEKKKKKKKKEKENIPLLGKWDLVWVSGNDVMWFLIPFLRKWDSYETNNWNKHLKLKYNIWKEKKNDFEENWTKQIGSDSLG